MPLRLNSSVISLIFSQSTTSPSPVPFPIVVTCAGHGSKSFTIWSLSIAETEVPCSAAMIRSFR